MVISAIVALPATNSRDRNTRNGMSGAADRLSTITKTAARTAAMASKPRTVALVQPCAGASTMAAMSATSVKRQA
jgi:hypothetical protein